jgi:hypothetical protein
MKDTGGRGDLVSERTRIAVRDLMSDVTLREIDQMWQDELFPPAEDPEPVGGQRVTRWQGYMDLVDWTDAGHVSRALRVFEVALRPWLTPPAGYTWGLEVAIPRLRRLLERDGYTYTDTGRIVGGRTQVVSKTLLRDLSDPAVIQDHLDRIAHAIERDDPALVIGSAKELIESTAKLVLAKRNMPLDPGADLPALINRAQGALDLHPQADPTSPDRSGAVKKILGASMSIAIGVAELRNSGYGTGHGPATPRAGLKSRHARLAVNAAKLWCEFVLDTLADESAPWRALGQDRPSTGTPS